MLYDLFNNTCVFISSLHVSILKLMVIYFVPLIGRPLPLDYGNF